MQFRIADTFTDSLAKLIGDEQRAVKTTAFDLRMDPAWPGLKLHQVEGARDKGFWSVRVSRDIRLIVHRSASSFLLCYVDHHDAAYQWAGRRRLERHPTIGAAQLVEIRENGARDPGAAVRGRGRSGRRPPRDLWPSSGAAGSDLRRRVGRLLARLRRAGRMAGRRPGGHRGHAARPRG